MKKVVAAIADDESNEPDAESSVDAVNLVKIFFLSDGNKWNKLVTLPTLFDTGSQMNLIRAQRLTYIFWAIVRVYTGKDGFERVVDVRTSSGTHWRPAHNMCVLCSRSGRFA